MLVAVQTPTELNSDDLSSGLIPLAVHHGIHHEYPKLLSIPICSTTYDTVHVPRTTVIGTLYPIEIKDIEVSNILWTKTEIQTQQRVQQNCQVCHLN